MEGNHRSGLSRRTLLKASGGALAAPTVGTARATDDSGARCPDATLRPEMRHCEGANVEGCADDHPVTRGLQERAREALETYYPNVGTLLEKDFVPYFDTLTNGEDGWSHWLSPEFIGDDTVLDPYRPESVLVDDKWWRPIGVMFIATRGGDPVDPPSVYETEGRDDDGGRCSPWHYHVGLPGRLAWRKYQLAYGAGLSGGLSLPCRTPCMMHIWTVPHPESVYAHDAPPREYRDGPPADAPGFDTDAVPGEDELGPDVLPDDGPNLGTRSFPTI